MLAPVLGDPDHRLLLARDLVADGYHYAELGALSRRGKLRHVRRGVYSEQTADGDPENRYRELVLGTVPMLAPGTVVSHVSAAVLHGLPVPSDQLDLVHVTRPTVGSGRRRGHVHRHTAALAPSDIAVVDGVLVTSLARTVVDLGRTLPFADAVAAADAALRARMDREHLVRAQDRLRGRPGLAAARRVVAFADGRSESVGESHSRVVLYRIGHAPTSLQHEVRDESGLLLGRGDFGWEEHRTIGEFDGRVKYERLLRPGQTPADAVYAEKVREDTLRDAGWQVSGGPGATCSARGCWPPGSRGFRRSAR